LKTFVKDLVVNAEVTSFFLIGDAPQVRKSKKDKDYWCVKLVDKTGEVDARVWETDGLGDANQFKKCFVKIRGMVGEWNDVQQVSVSQIRKVVESDDVDLGDFFERSEKDPEEMWRELGRILLENTDNFVYALLTNILTENEVNFKRAPAAKGVHHAFIGGLLEHVLSLCKTALVVSDRYDLSKELMLAACVLHDVGKIRELSYDMGLGYTTEGTLIGHISIGMQMTSDAIRQIPNFPPQLKMAILHLIAAHHGLREWGSPVVPLMRESQAFHLCDMIDSRLAICDKAIKKGISPEGLTEWVKELSGPVFIMKEEESV
jgi:3'-5' exoribonuclease